MAVPACAVVACMAAAGMRACGSVHVHGLCTVRARRACRTHGATRCLLAPTHGNNAACNTISIQRAHMHSPCRSSCSTDLHMLHAWQPGGCAWPARVLDPRERRRCRHACEPRGLHASRLHILSWVAQVLHRLLRGGDSAGSCPPRARLVPAILPSSHCLPHRRFLQLELRLSAMPCSHKSDVACPSAQLVT